MKQSSKNKRIDYTSRPWRLSTSPRANTLVTPRLLSTPSYHTRMLSRAWAALHSDDTPQSLAQRENVGELAAIVALDINRRLSLLLGPKLGPLLDRRRLSMRSANRLVKAVPPSAAAIVFRPWEEKVLTEAHAIGWHVMRDNGSHKEARELCGEAIRSEELRAYRLLAALLRILEHDPRKLPLEVALHTLRSEVIERRALPLIGLSWNSEKLLVPPMVIPAHRLKEYAGGE